MKYDLNNKTVVITGASSGIGKEMAERLIKNYNCRVYAIARREEILEEIKTNLGENFIPIPFDVSIEENWISFSENLQKLNVCVDVLINCAGILPKFESVEKTNSSSVKKVMETNFFSQIYATYALLPLIKKSKDGAIISVASASALCPFAGISSYCASKASSERFFECFSSENKEIYVATIMPGFVKTNIMKNQHASEKDVKAFLIFCADLNKTVSKIFKQIRRKKKRIIIGKDAHLINFMFKLFPNSAPKIITFVLKKSGLGIFSEI